MKTVGVYDSSINVIWDKYTKNFTYFNSFAPDDSPAKKSYFKENLNRRFYM